MDRTQGHGAEVTASTGRYARRGSLLAHFHEHVDDDTDECIEWPFHKGSHGYGVLTIDGEQRCVHVVACELAHGPRPPEKHQVAHSCDNRLCFNPRHLRWATRRENVQDMVSRNRHNFGGWNKGTRRTNER
jgi:hypothetical protein